ncbi:MAG: hypothetical protein ABEJ44_03260 [Halanaeroarchaeum sp.]
MRGQTTIDFLIGASVFLLTVGLVFGMVPGILDPFALEESAEPVVANRVATSLATDELATDATPYVLSESAVRTFFEDPAGIHERLALDEEVSINVTLENEPSVRKTVGPPLPTHGTITSAWRVVSYAGEQATLRVRIW